MEKVCLKVRKSDFIPVYKGKEDVRTCGNYRTLKLGAWHEGYLKSF